MNNKSKAQRINELKSKYGITEVQARHILSTKESYLTLEELKMKYENDEIGQLPEWLNEETLDKMIWKSIHTLNCSMLHLYKTEEDLYQDLQIFIRKKSNNLKNYNYLKVIIMNFLKSEITRSTFVYNLFPKSTEELSQSGENYEELYCSEDNIKQSLDFNIHEKTDLIDLKEQEIVITIREIKDPQIKSFLIVIGFLTCEIYALKDMFMELMDSSTPEIRNNLLTLYQENEKLILKRQQRNGNLDRGEKGITPTKVINALKLNEYTETIVYSGGLFEVTREVKRKNLIRETLNEFRFYLRSMNILGGGSY